MNFVLQKVLLSDKYPYSFYLNREKLIGLFPEYDNLVLEFLKATQEILQKGATIVTPGKVDLSWVAEGLNGNVAYIIAPFTTKLEWDEMRTSREFIHYHEVTDKLFPLLGWKDLGYKIINNFNYSLLHSTMTGRVDELNSPETVATLSALWDAS